MPVGGTIRVSPLGIALLVVCGLALAYLNMPGSGNDEAHKDPPRLVSMKRLLAVSVEVAKRGGREVKEVRESVS